MGLDTALEVFDAFHRRAKRRTSQPMLNVLAHGADIGLEVSPTLISLYLS